MRRLRATNVGPLLIGSMILVAAAVGRAGELEASPEGLDAPALARRAEQNLRGARTSLVARMTVRAKASAQPEEFRFHLWDDRPTDRTFVRVVGPDETVRTALLKLPPNLWLYAADGEVTRRVSQSELRHRWLEGDFTIDDLVRVSGLVDDYDPTILGVDTAPDGVVDRRAHVLAYVPHRDSPELWGRIVAWIDTEWGTPLRREYYDAAGQLVRILEFGGIREVQGRYYPHVWTARAPDSSGRESRIEVERIDFIAKFADSTFDIRNLKPPD